MIGTREEGMPTLDGLIDWLRNQSEERMKQAISRRSYKGNRNATEAELRADKRMAEKMFGRKLDLVSTKPEDNRQNCDIQEAIAKKQEVEARLLASWADIVAEAAREDSGTPAGKKEVMPNDGPESFSTSIPNRCDVAGDASAQTRTGGSGTAPTPEGFVGWNDDLRPQFEEEAQRFHVNLTTKDDALVNYVDKSARIAYIMFQFGYHLAAKIPVRGVVGAVPEKGHAANG